MYTLTFFITERCNRKCEYCDVPTIENPKDIDIELFLKYTPIINNSKIRYITLTGGEPGLLDEETLKIIFDNISCPVNVNTNGTFIERGYYDRWKNRIKLLSYHIIEEVEHKIDCQYILVSHKKNQDFIKRMCKQHPEIEFVIRKYENKKNITDLSFDEEQQMIQQNIGCFVAIKEIDWVNGYLHDCCKNITLSPKRKLNEKNLIDFMKNTKAEYFHMCDYCDRPKEFWELNFQRWRNSEK